jgi:putative acetyltransferase
MTVRRRAAEIEIRAEDPDQPEVIQLLAKANAHFEALYSSRLTHLLTIAQLKAPAVTFLAARQEGRLVGCGALRRYAPSYAEIKRMFVLPEMRGRGIGRRLVEHLERLAFEAGVEVLRLEAGRKQIEAIALYRALGFVERGPFGDYLDIPLSSFLEKRFS